MPCSEEKEKESRVPESMMARLMKSRTILLSGAVDEELATSVIAQTLVLDQESHDPIKCIVTTPGGIVDIGFAIHDVLQFVESKIICIAAGFVASMGVPIMLSAKKEDRFTLPNTRFMMHQPSTGAAGQAADIRITAQEILKTRERLNKLIAEESGQPLERVTADNDRDFWMSAQEAVEYGLVSKIITKSTDLG